MIEEGKRVGREKGGKRGEKWEIGVDTTKFVRKSRPCSSDMF